MAAHERSGASRERESAKAPERPQGGQGTVGHKPKRFRLNLVNAAEDVPRLVRAYGRACDGEFALVLRPREQRGVLVLVTKTDGARVWRSGDGDAPGMPAHTIEAADAVKLVKAEQKGLPKAGPITLRGQWSGYLHCDGGAPRVELRRKLAAYGVLTLTSSAEGAWSWAVERSEKWFSEPGEDTGMAPTLLRAIEAGLARAMGLLGEACSHRDSHRRSAFDEQWAEKYPIRPAREGRDPTERLKVKPPRASRKKAAPPRPVDAPVPSLPDVPATPSAMRRLEKEVTAEAEAISELRGVRWIWADSGARELAATWFAAQGLDVVADEIRTYDGSPDRPLDAFIDGLKADVRAEGLDAAAQTAALGELDRLREGLMEAPQLMERARKLIRYAAVMAESKLCQGKEKREANEAAKRAVQAYEDARAAIAKGRPVDGIRTLRRIGERVALTAAKASRSCAAGQTTLTSTIREAPAKPAPKRTRRARKAPAKPRVAAPAPAQPAGEVDAAKDKALLDAFSAAISAAMQGAA
jgi:hypothetical protein